MTTTFKRIALSAVAITAISGATMLGSTAVNAQESGGTVVERIASKFNLNKDEVQKVFDEVRDEQQAERQKDMSERLQDKVASGDINAEQKTLIENKFKELQTKREAEHDALEQWAQDNGIDKKYLHGGRGHGMMAENRLQDAVDDGDITAEQKSKIEAKLDELEKSRETAREELKQWAEENDIELRDVMPMGGRHMRGGFGGHM